MIFIYAPREIVMGDVQRIFYFHMAYVLVFTIAFIMNLFFSIKFLVDNKKINSVYAYVNGEIKINDESLNSWKMMIFMIFFAVLDLPGGSCPQGLQFSKIPKIFNFCITFNIK